MAQVSEWQKHLTLAEQWRVTKYVFRYANAYRGLFIRATLWHILVAVMNSLLPLVIQIYLDQYMTKGLVNLTVALMFLTVYISGQLLKFGLMYRKQVLFRTASERAVQKLRNDLYGQINRYGMRYYDQTPAGSIVSRVTNDTETIKSFWEVFLAILEGALGMITVLVAMFYLNASLAISFLAFVPLMIAVIYIYQRYSTRIYRAMRENLSQLNVMLNETISGIAIVQQLRQQKRFEKKFEGINNEYSQGFIKMIRLNALLLMPVIELFNSIALLIVLWIFGQQSLFGAVEVGIVYAFTAYIRQFFQPLGHMIDQLSNLQDGIVSSSRIMQLMTLDAYAPEQQVSPDSQVTAGHITFEHVVFSYDGETPILNDVSFSVKSGETLAIVGHTGSGKSSIINALMRFYEFQGGRILIDGHDIRSFSYEQLRKEIGLVLQDAFLFYGDIAHNIRLMDESITDNAIEEAARFVYADRFIERLPGGYHEPVIERGASFSSGEKQLLSFARTIVRHPKILILDEATANIDTETESYIQEGLKNMRQNRTTIAIAHRLSTIKDANHIIVLDHGKIAEQGTHDELLAQRGIYHAMYELQSMAHA